MQDGVLRATDIEVNSSRLRSSHPVAFRLFADETPIVFRIAKPQVIPTGTGPLWHRVRLANRFTRITNPFFRLGQWRIPGPTWFVILQCRRNHGQLAFVKRPMFPPLPNNRKGLAPITLTREKPVPQFVIDRSFA